MKVTVGFTSELNPDLVSKGIMWWLGTNYSHVFFILGAGVSSVQCEHNGCVCEEQR